METLRAKETYCFYCQGCMTRLLEDRWGADGRGRIPRLENGFLYTAFLRRKRSQCLLMVWPSGRSDSSGKKKLMDVAGAGVHSCQADWVRVIVLVRHKGLRCLLKKQLCFLPCRFSWTVVLLLLPSASSFLWSAMWHAENCNSCITKTLALWLYFSAITH